MIVHPLAHFTSDCKIGDGTQLWQFSSVIRGAEVGRDCTISACAIVDAARIGDRCLVGSGAQLHPGLKAGDEVFFGPACVVCNDPWPRVRKGDFDPAKILSGDFTTVRVESNASIGARAVVLPGVTIGANAMVAAGSVVSCCVPAGHLHKRSGEVVEISRKPISRMRSAGTAGSL